MQVFNPNNIKIYNLSSGKSLPEWISERKRRLLLKKDVDIRKRIELIQDFEMPAVSTGVKVTKDGQYIMATGVYKPRIRCYDVHNLSLKFERCFDAEAIQFEMLSDNYGKFVLLQCDRNIEFHAQYGCYYKTRIPKFGRDLAYHQISCDLYVVGASSEMYRFNLEQGRFLNSLVTEASSINKISINPVHDLVVCGTVEGKVEAWDPRDRRRVGTLDCGINCVTEGTNVAGFPSVTALKFKDALTLATGTSTGQILLFDIRTTKPYTIRDHMNDLEIKNIEFLNDDLVASLDIKCVKFWNKNTGKPFTYIEAPADLNDLCIVPNSGLMFMANEDRKILTYYIPSIGPAPKWCYFLDNITEELEESKADTIYDDYKFVTRKELEGLGLSHLVGTNLLRAYMHGYFMDIRLYNKAKAIVQPFAYKDFRKKKIDEKIESERRNRVITKQLPSVNKVLAQKLLETREDDKGLVKNLPKSKKLNISNFKAAFDEDRFKAMFDNPEFNIEEAAEDYNFIQPVLSQLDKANQKGKKLSSVSYEQFQAIEDEEAMKEYTSSEDDEDEDDDSDEKEESEMEHEGSGEEEEKMSSKQKLKFYEIKDTEKFSMMKKSGEEDKRLPIGERIQKVKESIREQMESFGNKQVTFTLQKSDVQKRKEEKNRAHMKERAMFRRSARNLRK